MPNLILVDKPQGITSFAAVSAIKRKLNIKRVGHTGTLDPMATGVLPILTGRASRLSSLMLDADKGYDATLKLGVKTDTLDITGTILETNEVNVTKQQFLEALENFKGTISQVPPMYSAIKKDGVRLYDLAREGKEVERKARTVEIKKLELVEQLSNTEFVISVLCSKGTYIRSLAESIGEYLGCGATLTALRRTEAAGFKVEDCIPLEKIKEAQDDFFLLSAEKCVMHFREINVSVPQGTRFLHGGELDINRLRNIENISEGEKFRVKCEGEFLGIGYADLEKNMIKIGCIIKED